MYIGTIYGTDNLIISAPSLMYIQYPDKREGTYSIFGTFTCIDAAPAGKTKIKLVNRQSYIASDRVCNNYGITTETEVFQSTMQLDYSSLVKNSYTPNVPSMQPM
jgi:hypothetical protein